MTFLSQYSQINAFQLSQEAYGSSSQVTIQMLDMPLPKTTENLL